MSAISVTNLQYLFKNILRINYFIKRKELNITKSQFYTIKSTLIQYVIQAVKKNEYENMPVSYCIKALQYQKVEGHTAKLVSFQFNIGDQSYECHQILDKKLVRIIEDDIKDITEYSEYIQTDDETLWPEKLGYPKELENIWKNIIMFLHNNNWPIFPFIKASAWAARIESLYPGINISSRAKKRTWNNNTLITLSWDHKKGRNTMLLNFLYARENLSQILDKYFPGEYEIKFLKNQ